jgi:hypothetical protein
LTLANSLDESLDALQDHPMQMMLSVEEEDAFAG